jgi:hypothetical protein
VVSRSDLPTTPVNSVYTSSEVMSAERYNVSQRALEKQLSRDADARALASGEKTQAQLCAENGAFAFPPERVHLEFPRLRKIKL